MFLEHSADLINKEGVWVCVDCRWLMSCHTLCLFISAATIVSEATGSLQTKLQEAGGKCLSPSPSSPAHRGYEETSKEGGVVEEPDGRGVVCGGEGSGQRQQKQPMAEQDLQARVRCMGQQAMDG